MQRWLIAGLLFCSLPVSAMELGEGISLDLAYIGEGVRNLQPGLLNPTKRTSYQDLLDASLAIEREGWKLFVRGMRAHGPDPSASRIGDLQTASNIEAPDRALLYEAWLELRFGKRTKTALLLGWHDLNSEFDVSEYASLLINSSFGIGPEISANVPTSIYPQPAAAVRLRIANDEGGYLALAAYDGDPATRAVRPKTEGIMYIGEVGLHWHDLGHPGVLKLGAWLHGGNKPSPFVAGKVFSRVSGRYFVAGARACKLGPRRLRLFRAIRRNAARSQRSAVLLWRRAAPARRLVRHRAGNRARFQSRRESSRR